MIEEKYMVRYTPSRFEKVEEKAHNVYCDDCMSGQITVESGYIIITMQYDDEYIRNVHRKKLSQAIKGLRVIKDMNNKGVHYLSKPKGAW